MKWRKEFFLFLEGFSSLRWIHPPSHCIFQTLPHPKSSSAARRGRRSTLSSSAFLDHAPTVGMFPGTSTPVTAALLSSSALRVHSGLCRGVPRALMGSQKWGLSPRLESSALWRLHGLLPWVLLSCSTLSAIQTGNQGSSPARVTCHHLLAPRLYSSRPSSLSPAPLGHLPPPPGP